MCGLAGWFGECNVSDHQRLRRAKALEALLLANAERGTDATGVGMVHTARPLTLYKRPVSSYVMMQDQYFNRIIRADDAEMAIAHTRYKTMGINKIDNAHPFMEGAVLGAHNGMITNYDELEEYYKDADFPPLRVDSQAAFRMLSQVSSDAESYEAALSMISGSLALSWHDLRDPEALWLFKHWNPLHIAIVPTIRSMFWSSQPEHLAIVMQAVYGNRWEPFKIREDTLYRLTWHKTQDTLIYDEFPVTMPKPNYGKYYSSGKGTQSNQKPIPLASKKKKPDWVDKGWSESDKDDPYLETCDMCKKNVDWEDEDATWIYEESSMLCGECMRWWEDQGMFTYQGDLKEAGKIMRSIGFAGTGRYAD